MNDVVQKFFKTQKKCTACSRCIKILDKKCDTESQTMWIGSIDANEKSLFE